MGFLTEGKEKEKRFVDDLSSTMQDIEIKFSSEYEDINEHVDIIINSVKYDVKGLRRIKRDDPTLNENFHWLEIKNVNGELGSIYGKADFIAFETYDYWVIVSLKTIQDFVKNNVTKTYVNNPDEALYCLYQRSGCKDILTLIKSLDLMAIADKTIAKKKVNRVKHHIGDSIYAEKALKQRMNRLKFN